MIPKEAIEKAIKGGYPKAGNFSGEYDLTRWHSIVLSPLFWQALGKALGWGLVVGWEEMYAPTENAAQEWYQNALRFYDLILTGTDTKEFWNEILK